MMVDVGKIVFDLIFSLLMDVIKQNTGISELNFVKTKKIENNVEASITEVIEPLFPYLKRKGYL